MRTLLSFIVLAGVLTLGMGNADAGHHPSGHSGSGKSCSLSSKSSGCSKSKSCSKSSGEYACPISAKVLKKACFFLSNKDEIGLSEDQISRIKAIKYETKKSVIRNAAEMKVFEIEIKQRLMQKPVDQDGINALLDQSGQGWVQGAKKSIQDYLDLKAILTDKQMDTAKEIWYRK